MALLLDELLNTDDDIVEFKGEKFKIHATFVALMKYQDALENYKKNMDDELFANKLGIAIFETESNYNRFNDLVKQNCNPLELKKIWTAVVKKWMDLLGLQIDENDKTIKKKSWDLIIDFDEIFASFIQAYNINLIKDNITFKQFIALFRNLPDDTAIVKIIKLRNMNPNDIKDVEIKKYRDTILLESENNDPLIEFAKYLK